ncbi:MAG: hypothetical protein A4E53_02341 [Pelotomaculum sp. PtaB.Bin104]|nr:MAG: hypothetical protein A4E53_02341 [Pelotomaculum sp. PtaB.Bin104]
MAEYRKSSHTVYNIEYHIVWVTKYRYQLLRGEGCIITYARVKDKVA